MMGNIVEKLLKMLEATHKQYLSTKEMKGLCRENLTASLRCQDVHNLKSTHQPSTSQSQMERPITEKQFTVVEEEFTRIMCTHCPEVTILRENTNTIVLKGPVEEVRLGVDKLDGLIKKVLEKRVMLPADLITFITYSGTFSKYQTHFRSLTYPVSLEVGSDLVLLSLSSDALDEALAVLLRDLSVEIVNLQGAAAAHPDLDKVKEILINAKNTANYNEFRVDFSFIPALSGTAVTKVRLVGFTENVNQLKQILHDYQMNHSEVEDVLNLRHPELVDCFDKFLELIGMKHVEVTLKALHSPYPHVLMSGLHYRVQEAKQALTSALDHVTSRTVVLDGSGAQGYFQAEGKAIKELVESFCQVLIMEQQSVDSPNVNIESQCSNSPITISPQPSIASLSSMAVNRINLKIKLGSLEDERVDVMVVPMLNGQLTSTKIGKCLLGKAFWEITDLKAVTCKVVPGDVLQIDESPSFGCSKIFFIECLPWDGVQGQSVQALGNGLQRCLDLCVQHGWCSVALPVIGPGLLLKYPWREAFRVLTEKICQFGSSASTGSLSTIHIVIKPSLEAEECFHDAYQHLKSSMNHGGQEIFRSLTSDLDDVTVTVRGGVNLQVVFGDITKETTDAVVNTTNFIDLDVGVCKAILSVAGPFVKALLNIAKVKQGDVYRTPPGSFPCKAILHVHGEKDTNIIEQLVCHIIQRCESLSYKSVAIPAICAGSGRLDPSAVAHAILRGIRTATSSTPLHFLTSIRLVLISMDVFLTFKQQIMHMFPTDVINKDTDLSILHTSSTSRECIFKFLGRCRPAVDDAMSMMRSLYQAHCSTKTFKKEDLTDLTQDDIKDLKQLVETHGLCVQEDQPGHGGLVVSGLKDGVNQVVQMLHTIVPLKREIRARVEKDLYTRVAWCIEEHNGSWERLPITASHNLESGNVMEGIVDTWGISWSVDLQKMEAKRQATGQTTKLKRLENRPDFTLPFYWDNMAPGENVKLVELQRFSAEYNKVSQAFNKTASKTIVKIERVQNLRLRLNYEVQKKHISEKNRQKQEGAGEKTLYHGTSQDTCQSIINNGFNRSFAGRHATTFGHGTYFAVNASYSAMENYAQPATDGSQTVFVARVLTGTYTRGQKDMNLPPLCSSQQPHDRYDSLVDKIDKPLMYVVFHDNQAYPDYLITFR